MRFNFVILLAIYIASSTDGGLASQPRSPFLLECRIPAPDNSSLSLNQSVNETGEEMLEQLELEGRCFVACATNYSNEVMKIPIGIVLLFNMGLDSHQESE